MSTISSIVNVNISVQSQGITQDAYNICMLLSSTKAFTEWYQIYEDMTEISAVFSPISPEYVCAQTFFSQTPTTTPLMIGRRQADSVTVSILPYVDSLYNYTITVNDFGSTVDGATAIASSSVTFVNTDAGATVPFEAGNIIDMTVAGVPIASVTATGTALTDISAIESAIVTAGGANIGTVSYTYDDINSPTSVLFSIAALATPTPIPVTITNTAVTGVAWTGTIDVESSTSPQQLAAMLASTINSNSDVNLTVQASASGASVIVSTFTGTNATGEEWTIDVSTTLSSGSAIPSSAYNSAYIQVSTESSIGLYSVNINGSVYSYQADITNIGTSQQASLGIYEAIIDGNPQNVDVSYDSSSELILIEAPTESDRFILSTTTSQRVQIISRMYLNNPVPTNNTFAGVQTDIANIAAQNPNFYAIACTDRTQDVVEGIASYVLSNNLLFGTASSDPNIINLSAGADTVSIAGVLNASGGDRTFVMYHQDAGNNVAGSYIYSYPEMAWFGRMLNTLPGSQNWALKRLAAVLPTIGLSSTQINNVLSKNCNIFYRISGIPITRWGTLSSGSYLYIDVLRGSDWLVAAIQANIYAALVSSGKIPYTDKGIEVVASIIKKQLQAAIDNGYLSSVPSPTVTVPSAASVSLADKTNRVLNNVSFTATLEGAINKVNINGTLTF